MKMPRCMRIVLERARLGIKRRQKSTPALIRGCQYRKISKISPTHLMPLVKIAFRRIQAQRPVAHLRLCLLHRDIIRTRAYLVKHKAVMLQGYVH